MTLSVGALVVAAAVLLAFSDDLRQAAGVAGFALLGAAVARFFDGYTAMRRDRDRALDETRRVLYMALSTAQGLSNSPETAGTVANALAHHWDVVGMLEAEQLAQAIVVGPTRTETVEYLRQRIREITTLLGQPVKQ